MMNPVEEAKQYAREAILETWPNVKETAKAAPNAYEYDAILIDNQSCEIASISIMHDPEAGTFSLMENPRPKICQAFAKQPSTIPVSFSEIDWGKLYENHAIAYLRGDLATSSPQSYSLEEMQAICADMEASTETIDAAMRADFGSLPPGLRVKFLDMLCASGCMTPEIWWDVLVSDNRSRTDADFAI